jgi:hypothetical protein
MNKEQINKKISELQENKTKLQMSFNSVSIAMINHLALKFPTSHFGVYKNSIKIFFEERPAEPITMFIKHVYANDVYRKKIKSGDDSFFMTQTYDGVINKTMTTKIFEFKELWKSFDDNNKQLAKQTMSSLIDRAELYLDILSDINYHKNLLK